MEFRFRYLGPDGGEVEVSSLERLRALVQSGTVGEPTLLYDALTREWAPARSHSVFRFLRGESLEGPPAEPVDEPAAGAARAEDPFALGAGFTLSAQDPADDADEAVRAILRQRERDDDRPIRTDSFTIPNPQPPVAAAIEPVAPPTPVPVAAPLRAPAHGPTVRRASPASSEAPRPTPLVFAPSPSAAAARSEAPAAHAGARVHGSPAQQLVGWLDDFGRVLIHSMGTRTLPGMLVLIGLIGLLLVLLATTRGDVSSMPDPTRTAAAVVLGPQVSRLVDRLGPAQASGFQSMVAGVDSLRHAHQIMEVPAVWLEGTYLADAPRYPEVKEFWTRYRGFLHDVEAQDTVLFRAGFVRSLEAQGISGAVVSLRLSQAIRDFERSQPERADVYRHMEDLSSAALDLHALLVDRAADITYEPALQRGVSREPVLEAVAEDTLLMDHMWTLLERIFASLEWVGGDLGGSRDHLTERLLQGIEAGGR